MSNPVELSEIKDDRRFLLVAHALFLTAALFALYFFAERNLGDSGWRIYCMLNREAPCPSHGRWILLVHQIPAGLAILAGLKMKTVLMIHAVSYIFIFYFSFLYCFFRVKDKALSVAILLATVFSIGIIFFSWSDLEKHLIIPLIILFIALMQAKSYNKLELVIVYPILLYLILSGHPVAILVVSFFFVWNSLSNRKINLYVLTLIVLIYLFLDRNMDAYEKGVMPVLNIATITDINDLNLKLHRMMSLLLNNLFMWMLACVVLVNLLREKKRLHFMLLTAFIMAYVWMILQFGQVEQQEPYLIPLSGVILILFMQLVGSDLALSSRMVKIYVVIFLVNIFSIWNVRHLACNKIALLDNLILKARPLPGHQFIVDETTINQFPEANLSGFWYAESMIRSNMSDSEEQVVLISAPNLRNNLAQLDKFINPSTLAEYFPMGLMEIEDSLLQSYANTYYKQEFLGDGFKMFFYDELNSRYFESFPMDFKWLDE